MTTTCLGLGAIVLLSAAACSPSPKPDAEQVMCTMEARSGINVEVLDASGDSLAVEPIGTARDGPYEETLTAFGNRLSGAVERKGTYALSVSAPGYSSWDTTGVVVNADECHVSAVRISVRLKPTP